MMRKFLPFVSALFLTAVLFGCGSVGDPESTRVEAPTESVSDTSGGISDGTSSTGTSSADSGDDSSGSADTGDGSSGSADTGDNSASDTDSDTAPDTSEPEKTPESLRAGEILSGMTDDEKIAQLIFTRVPSNGQTAVDLMKKYSFGGYVFFASDFQNRDADSFREYADSLKEAAKITPLLAADEEGGTVTRISRFTQYRASKFLSPRELMAGGEELVRSDTAEKCALLGKIGLNMNLAPVADISTDKNDFIYYRSAGDTDAAVTYVRAYVETSTENGIGASLKHFPGYGNNADTHTGIAVDERPIETFREEDFLPFQAGIDAGACVVMVSHNTVKCMDPDRPASLSAKVHEILRDELSFDGVITTDDLAMEAITDAYGAEEAAVLALEAGNDLICCSDPEVKFTALKNALSSGRITMERIEESVARILIYKLTLGIIG